MTTSGLFRQTFTFANKDITQWFPGHMATGMKQMREKLRFTDCILEVHDARVPFTGRNPNFYRLLSAVRPRLLILNKKDLIDKKQHQLIVSKLEEQEKCSVILTNCKDQQDKALSEILPSVLKLVKSGQRYVKSEANEFYLMIIGVPNVGKSSLINQLRGIHLKKAKATRVGASPGVTRSVLEKIKIHENPSVFLLDTPGILAPNVKNVEVGLKLALCAILRDDIVGEDIIADYLLYWLNKHENFSYVDYLGLKEPYDNITKVLLHTAVNLGKRIKMKNPDGALVVRPNLHAAATHMIKAFREGKFGKINLDIDQLDIDSTQEHLGQTSKTNIS